ncbi:MAG: hypothetical protein RLZZ450_1494 [Pseudomonadota bacterium]|jgi:hypothetical protein
MEDLRSVNASATVARGTTNGLRLSSGPMRHRDAPLCQLATWMGETVDAAERAGGGNPDALPLFYIRLYGVLTDVADFVALTVNDDQDGLCMFPLAREPEHVSPLPAAMARLTALLSEDELLYIEYQRHLACDPFQTKYRMRRGRLSARAPESALRHGAGHVPSALLDGRPVTIEEAESAFQRLFVKHDATEERIGVELVRRLLPALRGLDAAAH